MIVDHDNARPRIAGPCQSTFNRRQSRRDITKPKTSIGLNCSKVVLLQLVFWSVPLIAADNSEDGKLTTPRETAEHELLQFKTDLASSALERIADADTSSFRITFNDPGYPVARCDKPVPSKDTVSFSLPGIGAVICGNTEAGGEVAAWRRWYCEGIDLSPGIFENCVLGEWKNGQPTLSASLRLGRKVALAINGAKPTQGEISPFGIEGVPQKYESCRLGEIETIWKELENGDVVVTRTRPVHCK